MAATLLSGSGRLAATIASLYDAPSAIDVRNGRGGSGQPDPAGAAIMKSNPRPLALVTGASSGIGADLARELAKDGHDLVLSARRIEPMQVLAEELKGLGAGCTIIASDLSKHGAAAALVRELETRGMVIAVLINNAGLGDNGRFDQSD